MPKFTPLSQGRQPALTSPIMARLRAASVRELPAKKGARANPLGETKRGKRGGWVSKSGKGKFEHKRIRPPGHFDQASFRTVPWSFVSNADERAYVLKKLGKRSLPAGVKVITGRFLASTTRGRVKGKRVDHLATGVQAVLFPLKGARANPRPASRRRLAAAAKGTYSRLCRSVYGPCRAGVKVRLNPAGDRRNLLHAAVDRDGFQLTHEKLLMAKQYSISQGHWDLAKAIQGDMDFIHKHWKKQAARRGSETRQHKTRAIETHKAARHKYLIDWAKKEARRNPEIKIDLSPARLEKWAKKYGYTLAKSAGARREALRESVGEIGREKTAGKLVNAGFLLALHEGRVKRYADALKADGAWLAKESDLLKATGKSKYLTLKQAAKSVGFTVKQLESLIRQEVLRAYRDGKTVKVREADLLTMRPNPVRRNPGRLVILNPGKNHPKAKAVKGSSSKVISDTATGMKPGPRKKFITMVATLDTKERRLLVQALKRYRQLHGVYPQQLTKTAVKMPGKGKRFMVGIGKADHVGYHANKGYKGSSKKGTPFRHHFEHGQELVTDESGKSLAIVGRGTKVTKWIYG